MSSNTQLCSGYHITPYPERAAVSDPGMVVLHKMGSEERSFLTPTEARLLAKALTKAANEVRLPSEPKDADPRRAPHDDAKEEVGT